MDEALARFASRPLDEVYPYLILDARYEKVREDGVIRSQAVLIAIASTGKGSARCWQWSWPTGSLRPVGRTSWSRSNSAVCTASSSWSPTTMPG